MTNIVQRSGNIFNSDVEVVAVTVNCVGFMGKGMALECALRYPEIEDEYKIACKNLEVKTGKMMWVASAGKRGLVLFPTKNDFKHPSKLRYISDGLESLVKDLKSRNVKSIALPKLGTELGGLDWEIVEQEIIYAFGAIEIDLEIWSYDSKIRDPLITEILVRIANDIIGASEITGLSVPILNRLLSVGEKSVISGVADLLRIDGLGKQSVKKLISLSSVNFTNRPSLFD